MPTAAIAAAAPIAGALIGKAIGPNQGTTTAQLPKDLQQSRSDTINLMRYLLGMPGADSMFGSPQPAAATNNHMLGSKGYEQFLQQKHAGEIPHDPVQRQRYLQGMQQQLQQGMGGPQIQPFGGPPDSVPAMLRPGEYVLPPEMVRMLGGPAALDPLRARAMGQPQHFAMGGAVQPDYMGFNPQQQQSGPQAQPFAQPPVNFGDQQSQAPVNALSTTNQQPFSDPGSAAAMSARWQAANGGQGAQPSQQQRGDNPNPYAELGGTYRPGYYPGQQNNPYPGTIQMGDAMQGGAFPALGSNPQGQQGSPAQSRLESFFGPLGVQSTPLQRQATGGIQQFLNQPSPESRTLNQLNPGLMQMFGQNQQIPQNIMDMFGGAQGALQGQLGGQNPLNQQLQQILGGMAGGSNPLPGQAQQALMAQLGANPANGAVNDVLNQILRTGGMQAFAGQGAGGSRVAYNANNPSPIQKELNYNPNQQFLDALQPRFEQNLALADQAGGRFGSANALGRSQATNDYNLMASQAMQQDLNRRAQLATALEQSQRMGTGNFGSSNAAQEMVGNQLAAAQMLMGAGNQGAQTTQGAAQLLGQFGNQGIGNQQSAAQLLGNFSQQGLQNQQGAAQLQQQGAGALGNLGLGYGQMNQQGQLGAGQLMGNLAGQAGQNDFNRLLGAFGIGTQQAGQNDIGTQRNIDILMNMLGGMQQSMLGAPVSTTPTGAQTGAQLGTAAGQTLGLFAPQQQQGRGQQPPPGNWYPSSPFNPLNPGYPG